MDDALTKPKEYMRWASCVGKDPVLATCEMGAVSSNHQLMKSENVHYTRGNRGLGRKSRA